MRRPLLISLLVAGFFVAPAFGQDESQLPSRLDQALQDMLSERESPGALDERIEAARKLGATEQAILEARFLYHVDRREDDKLAAMLPELEAQAKNFKLSESQIFAVEEDWFAILEYVRAIKALEEKDRDGFKKHITEAFWLSPQQGAAFAPHIERLRLEEAMKKVKVDFSLSVQDLNGETALLQSLAKDRKAVLLHFFSPWSRECEESLPDFTASAKALEQAGIAVVTIIGESMPEAIADTRAILEATPGLTGSWLIDHDTSPLSRTLRIQAAPTMVLVELDGTIRFNGHPSDPSLWSEVKGIAPGFKRPEVDGNGH
ncbi:TlpA family protein disulfide reductase [Haloferula rosea]|uniref:Redoxin domain-containing protein n=1 Tax=Haloferula rosea TaxID=490093 RepID=A0A934RAL1_9BACT|nr:redoxin domain-containing protein [Haloferula rosea]MBK1826990.1 redoxin domain-containing protein [Haloferula rosea]